jgi:hypothetical protein
MSGSITVASPPTTAESTAIMMAMMEAQSGVVTDYNKGSQIRTFGEAVGEINEEQGIINQALAYQAVIYSAYAAFGIVPLTAAQATGVVTFSTGGSPATQDVPIPSGTVVATTAGTQYQTIAPVTLLSGTTSISVGIIAVNAGSIGNCSAGAIVNILSGLPYFLYVTNSSTITNGSNAEAPAQTLARFTATVASLGEASPVSIANACIGVTNGTEIVMFSTVYEPWTVSMASPLPVGYNVYIDNGSGTASSPLVANVLTKLMGNAATGAPGYHPAGVPFTVAAGTGVTSSVVVSAVLTDATLAASLETLLSTAVTQYYSTLGFAETAQLTQITAAVGNVLSGYVTSLAVTLLNSSSASVTTITAAYNQRVILSSLTATLT